MTPTQVLTVAGPYRDNRRGTITVETTAGDMAEIVISIGPGEHAPATVHRIVLAGEHLSAVHKALGAARIKPACRMAVAS